jgi:hypothetical protein
MWTTELFRWLDEVYRLQDGQKYTLSIDFELDGTNVCMESLSIYAQRELT